MNGERWQKVEELFNAALEVAPAQRRALLDSRCAGDSELRAEVERLLASKGLSLARS